jgi:hypothetical protein
MSLERAQQIADTIVVGSGLGGLMPRAWAEHEGSERWWLQAQLLVEGRGAHVQGRLRFLETITRCVEYWDGERYVPVGSSGPAEELRLREVPFRVDVEMGGASFFFDHGASSEIETLVSGDAQMGRLRRERRPLRGVLRAWMEPLAGHELHRVTLRVENLSELSAPTGARDQVLGSAFGSTHLVVGVQGGALVSLWDPPQHARAAAAGCQNVGVHPAIVSERGACDEMLCSPIHLPDHPIIARQGDGTLEAP